MDVKELLKKNDSLRKLIKGIKIRKDFRRDAKDFCSNYMEAKCGVPQLEYNTLLIVHSLEKGLSSKELRPFGKKKVLELIRVMSKFPENYTQKPNTPYIMGISILKRWKDTFDENAWEQDEVYNKVDDFLSITSHYDIVDVGSFKYTKAEALKYYGFDFLDAIKTRHSVREFSKINIKEEDIQYCVKAAIAAPSACNRQMCKVYRIANPQKIAALSDVIMGLGGFEREGVNFFVFTYDIAAFSFYGERNQGYFNTGLFAMNFANALHFKGIGSCFLQWGNTSKEDEIIREKLNIPESERIVVVLAAGYYKDETMSPCSYRKTVDEVYRVL